MGVSVELKGNSMLTPFGKALRRERLEQGTTLGEMANALGVSSSFLSQIETGKKGLTDAFVRKVINHLGLNISEQNALWRDAASTRAVSKVTSFNIKMPETAGEFDRELAARLSFGFARMSPKAKARLDALLKEVDNG
jgi:HTH-type transcriptional regulator, competence development regulator